MIWILDAGHGGMHEGKYMTDPKWGKFYKHSDQFTAYEGVTNRGIAARLIGKLKKAGIKYETVYHEYLDTPLKQLTAKMNSYAMQYGKDNCCVLSIHSNAGKGTGIEVFTSIGQTKSDPIAEVFYSQLVGDIKKINPSWGGRPDITDGDHDKEMKLAVTDWTACPSVLVELLFFDEIKQALFLDSDTGQEHFAESLFKAIKQIEK